MKFLIDMPLPPDVAVWFVQRGHDAIHAVERGLMQATDETLLVTAQQESRIVVTADLDFARLFALLKINAPGLILFRGGQHDFATITSRLDYILEKLSAEELMTSVIVIDQERIRKRSLPIGGK